MTFTPPTSTATPSRTRRPVGRAVQAVAAAGVVAALAAGCGSSGSTTSSPAAATPAAASPGSSAAPASSAAPITATMTEFKIALSRTTLTPGTYTFDAVNAGHTVHALAFTGPGLVGHTGTAAVQPGQSVPVTVTLRDGTYDVYCPVGDHKALGMNLSLTVSGSGGATSGAAGATSTTVGGSGY